MDVREDGKERSRARATDRLKEREGGDAKVKPRCTELYFD